MGRRHGLRGRQPAPGAARRRRRRSAARRHGTMLVIRNDDQPGVIGEVGTMLGRHGINIAQLRARPQRRAARSASSASTRPGDANRGRAAAIDGAARSPPRDRAGRETRLTLGTRRRVAPVRRSINSTASAPTCATRYRPTIVSPFRSHQQFVARRPIIAVRVDAASSSAPQSRSARRSGSAIAVDGLGSECGEPMRCRAAAARLAHHERERIAIAGRRRRRGSEPDRGA